MYREAGNECTGGYPEVEERAHDGASELKLSCRLLNIYAEAISALITSWGGGVGENGVTSVASWGRTVRVAYRNPE